MLADDERPLQKKKQVSIDVEATSPWSDDALVKGFRREASTPRIGSALHRNSERPRYLRGLTMRRHLRQAFSSGFFRSRSGQLDPDSEGENSERQRQVKEAVTREFMFDEVDDESMDLRNDDSINKMFDEVHTEREVVEASQKLRELHMLVKPYLARGLPKDFLRPCPLEVRIQNACYNYIAKEQDYTKISTVYNTSCLYSLTRLLRQISQCKPRQKRNTICKPILTDINLVIQPGKQYLVLGPPGSGKTTLLKMIAGLLPVNKHQSLEGIITYNGRSLFDQMDGICIANAFGYVDQLDQHAALLTVGETLDFAFQCQGGGKFIREREDMTPEQIKVLDDADRDHLALKTTLCILGLQEVKDTFVGDANVRGVSGGQRRRVTVGEMIMSRVPVLCGDEISTGLDAASTYDMIEMLLHIGRRQNFSRVFSLLQPAPEVVSLFDEVIVLSEGHIIYAGPIERVEDYFAELGFVSPQFCDVADFLQLVSTEDRDDLYAGRTDGGSAPSVEELATIFKESADGRRIHELLVSPEEYGIDSQGSVIQAEGIFHLESLKRRYANKWYKSVYLISRRFLVLWKRDRKVLLFSVIRNVINGASVGGAFFNAQDFISIQGALFQTGIFILLGSLQSVAGLVADRTLYYKHAAANFYSAWPYVIGRSISQTPQTLLLDTIVSGSILYWMIGLGNRASASNFFVYLSILFVFASLMNQQMAMFASFATESKLQVYSAITLFFAILFSGFIVPVDTIPSYYVFLYWLNPFAWAYNALIVNEAYSGREEDPTAILIANGFVTPDGEVFDRSWIGWSIIYMIMYWGFCTVGTALGLTYWRASTKIPFKPRSKETIENEETNVDATNRMEIPFQALTLSFQDVCYEVTASKTKDKLMLLKNVNGIFRPGRMCALMGASGAGKTTLMDVIALRKRSGTVTGQVCLNGWAQDPESFRRCSGYVEQFDVQSPELTVRETVIFSARLRLDPKIVRTDEEKLSFVDQILQDMELSDLKNVLVGTEDGVGLSFEQKKRLSIAVELAASPSILFLDEPTSGLDARSALLVVRLLRKITDSGRTCVATIHQPSSSVFGMFDDLLLLQRGGQVVYHGPLGENSCELISYFESHGASPIELGDNPANWILRVIQDPKMGDLAETYRKSDQREALMQEIALLLENQELESKMEIDSPYAVSRATRQMLVSRRLRTIYWRSTTYNLGRIMISLVMACLLGAVFITDRKNMDYSESDIRARISVIFFSNIIVGIMSIVSVLPVMTWIRDMFYRHHDAGMYDSLSLGFALGTAEQWFIASSSALFCLVFLSAGGFTWGPVKVMAFYGFFTFNSALFSYFGQFFVSVVKNLKAAMILAGVYIGFNNLFSGLIILPQAMLGTPYAVTYFITPGHYIFEGEITSIMDNDNRNVTATVGSDFYAFLVGKGICIENQQSPCKGYQSDYIDFYFGGDFQADHISRNAIVLGILLVVVRLGTWYALQHIRFS